MKTISIYNSFIKNNDSKRDYIANQLKANGFRTSRNGELLIVIGGDGTFLSAVQKRFAENPVFVGFNTGNLGFFSEFSTDRIDDFVTMIKKGEYVIQHIPLYQVRIKEQSNEITEVFMNDLTIERKSTKILHMGVHIDKQELGSISGDGIVLASGIGSTGYNLSCQGALSLENDGLLQLTPISPVSSKAYHSIERSVVFKDQKSIDIFPNFKKQRPFRIVVDGREVRTNTDVRFIEVFKSSFSVRILRTKKFNALKQIKDKFEF